MQQSLLGSAGLQIDGAKGRACARSQDLLVGLIRLMLQGGFDPRHELPHLLVATFELLPGRICDGVEQVECRGERQACVFAHQRIRQRQHPARHRRRLSTHPELLDGLLHQPRCRGEVSGGKRMGNGLGPLPLGLIKVGGPAVQE